MTSSAISAQGATLSIQTGTGGAKTITAIALGVETILTAAAHGFLPGDVIALAGLTGADAATLNGKTVVVRSKTTNTWAVDIDTTGLTITAAGTATPATFTAINNIKDFSGFDGAASELDRTNLQSTAKEFLLGLVDPGNFTINIDVDQNDTGQAAVRAKQQSGAISTFKLVLPGGVANETYTFTAFVKKFTTTGGVDAIVKGQVDLRISGTVTLT
jgi:hypothetical protein